MPEDVAAIVKCIVTSFVVAKIKAAMPTRDDGSYSGRHAAQQIIPGVLGLPT